MIFYKFVANINGKSVEGHLHDMKWNCIAEALTFLGRSETFLKEKLSDDCNAGIVMKELNDFDEHTFYNCPTGEEVKVKIISEQMF